MSIYLALGLILVVYMFLRESGGYLIAKSKSRRAIGNGISEVGNALIKEYNSLPPDQQPFPNIVSLVKDLDEQTGQDPVDRRRHFDANWLFHIKSQNGMFKMDWRAHYCTHGNRYGERCQYSGYYDIHMAIKEVKDSIRERDRALAEARLAPSMDMIKELQADLRREAKLNRSFVTDFKELN